MSRVGEKPIEIPAGVTVKTGVNFVEVNGPLGNLKQEVPFGIKVGTQEGKVLVKRESDVKKIKALHGLIRSLIANMILGVTAGWQKKLEVHGTGYWAKVEGTDLALSVGFSHLVKIPPPEGIKFQVNENKEITVSGINKILVGNVAAKIRKVKPPNAYKGSGIRYQGEVVKLKPGKAGKAGAAGGGAAS